MPSTQETHETTQLIHLYDVAVFGSSDVIFRLDHRDRSDRPHHCCHRSLNTQMTSAFLHALSMAFAMFWEIFWALALGFFISGIVQAVVSKKEMSRLLPDDRAPSIW